MKHTPAKLSCAYRVLLFCLCAFAGLVLAGYLASLGTEYWFFAVWLPPHVVGAALFCIYAPALAERIRDHEHVYTDMLMIGATYAIWGPALGLCFGGFGGVLHAIACTSFFVAVLKSPVTYAAPLCLLVPAWVLATAHDTYIQPQWYSGGWTTHSIAVVLWNAMMYGWLTAAARCAERGRAARRGLCEDCGYSLAGLTGDRCPECGTLIAGNHGLASGRAPMHEADDPLDGVRAGGTGAGFRIVKREGERREANYFRSLYDQLNGPSNRRLLYFCCFRRFDSGHVSARPSSEQNIQ